MLPTKINNILQKMLKHKVITALAIVLLAGGGYLAFTKLKGNTPQTRYVTAAVEKGTLISSISGTGSISATNQVDIKAKASGEVYNVPIKSGQTVKSGAALAYINARDALKSVRDAQISLESAKLSLEKLSKPASQLTVLQAENSLAQAKENKQKAEDSIMRGYEDAYNTISDTFLDLPTVMTEMNEIVYGYEVGYSDPIAGSGKDNSYALYTSLSMMDREKLQVFQTSAQTDYNTARAKYDANFTKYKNSSRYASQAEIEQLLTQTLDTVKSIAQSAKSESNYLDTWVDLRDNENAPIFSKVSEFQSNLSSYISQTNNHLSGLLSVQRSLQDNKEAVLNAERTISEKNQSFADLNAGAEPLDLRAQQLAVNQRQIALQDAREKLADYSVRAPFGGIIAAVSAKKGDTISSGSAIATLITKQKLAEISLNEVDVAKVKVGQKATLAFDAVDSLNISGDVVEIDQIGTASQGVVTYKVKISFDVQDDRIKPGMSVSANVILDSKLDVLIVSNAAIKTQDEESYVEELDSAGAVVRKTVKTGLIGDTNTEITEGLSESEEVITQKITVTAGSTAAAAASRSSGSQSARSSGFSSGGGMMQMMR